MRCNVQCGRVDDETASCCSMSILEWHLSQERLSITMRPRLFSATIFSLPASFGFLAARALSYMSALSRALPDRSSSRAYLRRARPLSGLMLIAFLNS